MLKVIMGSEYADKFINTDIFIKNIDLYFNKMKKTSWFEDPFVREIMADLDKVYVESGYITHSILFNERYTVDDLAIGTKFLILVYKLRDKVYFANVGDNGTDFLEKIAQEYDEEGRDLIIVSNYLQEFRFIHVNEVEYLNYDIICHNQKDVQEKVCDKWIKQALRLK